MKTTTITTDDDNLLNAIKYYFQTENNTTDNNFINNFINIFSVTYINAICFIEMIKNNVPYSTKKNKLIFAINEIYIKNIEQNDEGKTQDIKQHEEPINEQITKPIRRVERMQYVRHEKIKSYMLGNPKHDFIKKN